MKRRDFISAAAAAGLAGAPLLSAQAAAATPFFELRFYRMHQGTQGRRMSEFFRNLVPLARKLGFPKPPFGPWGFFNVEMGPSPTLVMLLGFPSFADRENVRQRLFGNPEFQKSLEAFDAGDAEPPYDRMESSMLMGMPFSPPLKIADAPPKTPRVFELRVYESQSLKHQSALVRRMADPEAAIFTRSGFDNILFSTCLIGANMPNFTYMIAFDNMAERDKGWAAFRADPEWIKVRDASIKESGQIVSRITNYILRPTPYSPIQ